MGRLALLLFGNSLGKFKRHNHGTLYNVNYKLSYLNYKKYIYEYFENLGFTIDTYIATNELNENDKK